MGISDWSSDVCSSDLSKSSKTSRPRSDRSRASARPRSFRYGDLAPGCTTRAILAPLNGAPVPAAALGVVEGFVGESIELLEIARRPHLGDPDARGDQPLAHRLAMIARRDPARSEEHTSELQSLLRIPYAVFCLKKKITTQ